MASLNKIITVLLVSNMAISQVDNDPKIINDTIVFTYKKAIYDKMAKDSIKLLYNRQLKIYTTRDIRPDQRKLSISLNYQLKDLSYFAIPKYRLYKDAYDKFDCNSDIEDFIEFEEYDKYQASLVCYKNQVLSKIEVPNPIFERQRVCNPGLGNTVDKSNFEYFYIEKFHAYPGAYKRYNDVINYKTPNFFFEIWGLSDVLFEVDAKTGLLYSYYYGLIFDYGTNRRQLANDFIRNYLGQKKINVIASGNYRDYDKEEIEMPKPCAEKVTNNRKVYLKVIRK